MTFASCTAKVPTPPPAPMISTRWPGARRPWSRRPWRAVIAATGMAAATCADLLVPIYSGRLIDAIAAPASSNAIAVFMLPAPPELCNLLQRRANHHLSGDFRSYFGFPYSVV